MKKIKLLFLFLTVSLVSFAGNPKYMHVSVIYHDLGTTLYILDETGKKEEQMLKSFRKGLSMSMNNTMEIQAEIQNRLNALGAKGWKVAGISNLDGGGAIMVNYLLVKED